MLPIIAVFACSPQCYNCVDPNSTPELSQCLSCKADYFLFNQTCIKCDNCSAYNSCGNCIPVGDGDGDGDTDHEEDKGDDRKGSSKSILIIVFAILGGIASIVIGFCLIRKYCRPKSLAQNNQIIELRHEKFESDQQVSEKE